MELERRQRTVAYKSLSGSSPTSHLHLGTAGEGGGLQIQLAQQWVLYASVLFASPTPHVQHTPTGERALRDSYGLQERVVFDEASLLPGNSCIGIEAANADADFGEVQQVRNHQSGHTRETAVGNMELSQ